MGNIPWKGARDKKPQGYDSMSDDKQLQANIDAASASATEKATNSQNNLNNSIAQSSTLLDANLDKYAKLLSLSNEEGASQARINALKQIAKEALEREQKIRTTIVQDLGQVGALQVEQNENIQQASIEAKRNAKALAVSTFNN